MNNMSESLYELSSDYQLTLDNLMDMLDAGDIDEQAFLDTMEGIEDEVKAKATAVASYILNMRSLAANIKEAEANMAARRKSLESKATRLSDYLLSNLEAAGIPDVQTPLFAIKIKKLPPSVVVAKGAVLPDNFINRKVTETPNKVAIKNYLKEGNELAGVELVSGKRLEVK